MREEKEEKKLKIYEELKQEHLIIERRGWMNE